MASCADIKYFWPIHLDFKKILWITTFSISFSAIWFHYPILINQALHSLTMLQRSIINIYGQMFRKIPCLKVTPAGLLCTLVTADCDRAALNTWHHCGVHRSHTTWVIFWAMILNNQRDTKLGHMQGKQLRDSQRFQITLFVN